MKNLVFLILIVTIAGCKDDNPPELVDDSFVFYNTEGARWHFSDTTKYESIDRGYPNRENYQIQGVSCYATLIFNNTYTLGKEMTLSSKSILNDFDTTELLEFEYFEVLGESTFQIDSSFAVRPNNGDPFHDLSGSKTIQNGTASNPVLSGWIRFDKDNKKVFSRRKIGDTFFDIEVFDFGCEEGCEEILIEGETFLKTPQLFKYAVSGISLTHFSVIDLPAIYTQYMSIAWRFGCNFSLEYNEKTYQSPRQ
jgi:hypothetical protein